MARKQQSSQRLRKQPRVRRVKSAHALPLPRVEVPPAARKRKRRNQRKRRQQRMPIAATLKLIFLSARWISLGLLTLTIYALVLIGLDERFYLTVVPIDGIVSIPATEIVEASQLAGAHVFAVDPGAAAARVANMPGVINAAVTLTWPNRVLIEIEEDSPVAAWLDNGQDYWVTGNGRFIPARAMIPGLLLIESEIEADAQPDEGAPILSLPFIPEDMLTGAQQLRSLRPNIEKLYYRQSSGLSYQDERGWRVYFGTGADMPQKLVIYETIADELLARGLTPQYISVSNQEKPYYRVGE
ncbi:MAG: FtsQ-type POTRA domain-containing protein [Chloroflexi bacterium]|nr:FtsQ-type POTRA domain-containing protein [Chloroflexota bacterium]